jgi:sulfatase maturation enzyme AslB (radical SAM superfamily)
MRYCRWSETLPGPVANLRDQLPYDYFHNTISPIRSSLLDGDQPQGCRECHVMEKHGKISGRQRQLLKVGVQLDNFEKTMQSSPFWTEFSHSNQHQGAATGYVRDWHIDLGNFCNSACVFCLPESSSKLASELYKLQIIDQLPLPNWSNDPLLVQRVIDALKHNSGFQYVHFIGGETLITPAFQTILKELAGTETAIGFTTNLTVWPTDTVEILKQFKEVNIGLSVECMDRVNDYVRYPSNINVVKNNLDNWVLLSKQFPNWNLTMRITPTVLTASRFLSVYDYALIHNLNVESCNFLHNPRFLRLTVLPQQERARIADQIQDWLPDDLGQKILNIRNPEFRRYASLQDAASYVQYLRSAPDETHLLPELGAYLRRLDSSRGLNVLDYLPEYEHIFRTARYQTNH